MIQVVGCSPREVPPSRLGTVIGDPESRLAALLRLKDDGLLRGAVLLTTCNRIEVVLDADDSIPTADLLTADAHHRYLDHDAVQHLLRVAVGLDSVVRGEDQIHGQLREAFKTAERHDLLSPRLRVLRNELIAAAREVRQRTGLAKCETSVASVAARELMQAGPRLAVIGAGDTGRLALETLSRRSGLLVTLVNRTLSRAEAVAQHFGVTARALADFLAEPGEVDGILIAVHSRGPVLRAEHVRAARRVIDISQPGVLADCIRQSDCEVLDLDAIANRVDTESARMETAFGTAEALVRGRARSLHRLVRDTGTGRHLSSIIDQHVEGALQEVDNLLATRLNHLSESDADEIRASVLRAARHNAHRHVRDLREFSGS